MLPEPDYEDNEDLSPIYEEAFPFEPEPDYDNAESYTLQRFDEIALRRSLKVAAPIPPMRRAHKTFNNSTSSTTTVKSGPSRSLNRRIPTSQSLLY
ncbi:unnamed protein product [Toxocara canis]|uniref:Movement protein n=1 Tax=Toxocara canis TaxID=6265 RepID=A0A183VGW0_TOXCA|nr:unnamed protein product [Toxocara canis]